MYDPILVIQQPDGWLHPYTPELPQDLGLGTTNAPCRCGVGMLNARHRSPDLEQSIAFMLPPIAGDAVALITCAEVHRQSPERTFARMVAALLDVVRRA